MVKPYSDDLRERVVAALGAGESCRTVAQRFGIAPSTVVKWSKRLRETGSVSPAKMGGYVDYRLQPHRDFIHASVAATPHLTLRVLRDLLAERGVRVSTDTVWRFLRREGLSFKKNATGD